MEHVAFYFPIHDLLTAMIQAEGGEDHFLTAIRCSMPECASFGEAVSRACKTIRNRILQYEDRGLTPLFSIIRYAGDDPWTGEAQPRRLVFSDQFIKFLGQRWAPVGADNDPQNLNHHWVGNVLSIYHRLVEENDGDRGIEPAGSRGAGESSGTVLPSQR